MTTHFPARSKVNNFASIEELYTVGIIMKNHFEQWLTANQFMEPNLRNDSIANISSSA